MKALMALVLMIVSAGASAGVIKKRCDFADYNKINTALETMEVHAGAELKSALVDMLEENKDPNCNKLVQETAPPGVSGDRWVNYEIGALRLAIKLRSFEMPRSVGIYISAQ